jgi:chromosome segregation ATPase
MLSSLDMEEPTIEKLLSYFGNVKKQLNGGNYFKIADQFVEEKFSNGIISQIVRFSNKSKSITNVKGLTNNPTIKEVESFFNGKFILTLEFLNVLSFLSNTQENSNITKIIDSLESHNQLYDKVVRLLEDKNLSDMSDVVKILEYMLEKDKEMKNSIEIIFKTFESKLEFSNSKIKIQSDENYELRMKIKKMENEILSLNNVKNKFEGEIDNLTTINIRESSKSYNYESELKILQCINFFNFLAEIKSLKEALRISVGKIEKEDRNIFIERLEKEISETSSKLLKLNKENQNKDLEIEDLNNEVETLKKKYNEQNKISSEIQHQIFEADLIREDSNKRLKQIKENEDTIQRKEKEYHDLFTNYCKVLKENEKLYSDNLRATKGIKQLRLGFKSNSRSINDNLRSKTSTMNFDTQELARENDKLKVYII